MRTMQAGGTAQMNTCGRGPLHRVRPIRSGPQSGRAQCSVGSRRGRPPCRTPPTKVAWHCASARHRART
eukprot:245010-Rhodomonas_salina.2